MNRKLRSLFLSAAFAACAIFSSTAAQAADGCKFLLCIAGPWSSISQCVDTVHEVFRDIALGRGIPTCDMAGDGNSAVNNWVDESSCPSMWKTYSYSTGDSGGSLFYAGCAYPGRVSVYVSGQLWSQVFWAAGGGTSTWYSDIARAQLSSGSLPLDPSFGQQVAAWNSANVPQCVGGTVSFDAFGAFSGCAMPDTSVGGGGGD